MASIFSVQNLQTFLRRKYFRPPSRDPPGPPPGRGPRGPRSLRSGRSPPLRSGRASLVAAGVLVSSAIVLLRTFNRPYGTCVSLDWFTSAEHSRKNPGPYQGIASAMPTEVHF